VTEEIAISGPQDADFSEISEKSAGIFYEPSDGFEAVCVDLQ